MAKLTVKQRLFLKELVATLSPTEAAMRIYNCKDRNSAKVIASQNLTKFNFTMPELMDKMGLGIEEDISDLKRLRKAKRVIGYLHQYKKNKKGEIKKVDKISPDEVVSNEFIEVDDNQAQLKALELSLKIKGYLKEKTEHSFDDGTRRLLQAALVKMGNAKK